jgi:excisionase family DNA binding protein
MELIITTKTELTDLIQTSLRTILGEKSNKKNNYEATDYLSIEEASSYLRIPVATIYQYCSARRIPFVKRGKRNYFLKSEIDEWAGQNRKLTVEQIQKELLFTSQKGGGK